MRLGVVKHSNTFPNSMDLVVWNIPKDEKISFQTIYHSLLSCQSIHLIQHTVLLVFWGLCIRVLLGFFGTASLVLSNLIEVTAWQGVKNDASI